MLLPDDRHSRLRQLLEKIAESLDISMSRYEEAKGHYDAVGKWLGKEDSPLAPYDPDIFPQGSFRLGTVIKPISDEDEYDIDLVCELNLTKDDVTQKQLKKMVGDRLKANETYKRMLNGEEGRRCWTLNYADGARFHMDILPAIPEEFLFKWRLQGLRVPAQWAETAICITDNTYSNYALYDHDWPCSNPKGYAEWFKERMKTQFDLQRSILAKSMRASIEDVPDYRVKTPLQRSIQILKRHRDIMFKDDQDDKPISIIITTLAALAYDNEADLLEALTGMVRDMPSHIQTMNGVPWVPNPVNPKENFADKWQEHPQRERKFKQWLLQVQVSLEKALRGGDIWSMGESLKGAFGEQTLSKSLQHFPQTRSTSSLDLMKAASYVPCQFNVSHRQQPMWPEAQKGWVRITGWASRNGFRPWQFQSDSASLPKRCSLRFEAETNISWPYKVYWQVVNTGSEARNASCLRGGFYDGILQKGGLAREESTLYTGMHWVECFIVKNNMCVARSGEFVVNIE